MTGNGACVRSAMYSVCPVKSTPAWLIRLFCTGAVTMRSELTAEAPVHGAIDPAEHCARVAPSRRPGTHGTASG